MNTVTITFEVPTALGYRLVERFGYDEAAAADAVHDFLIGVIAGAVHRIDHAAATELVRLNPPRGDFPATQGHA